MTQKKSKAKSGGTAVPKAGKQSVKNKKTAARKNTGKKKTGTGKTKSARVNKVLRKKKSKSRLLLCALIEVLVLSILAMIVGWDFGVENFLREMSRPVVKELDLSGVNSRYAILMRARGGNVLGEIQSEERMYPASLTKIMTVMVALEELEDLQKPVRLNNFMFESLYGRDATQAGFQPEEAVRAIDLLYGAMLPSGAECCLALAYEVAGSESAFVELMNRKAQKIGMEHTHFCNTTGLHEPEHYSTAKDLAFLLKYAIRNDTFREMAESRFHSTGVTNVHPQGITYYSTMFQQLSDPMVTGGKILGGKTGFTNEAGLCLASYADIEGREYILVTGGASGNGEDAPHIEDARMIYDRLGNAAQKLQEE